MATNLRVGIGRWQGPDETKHTRNSDHFCKIYQDFPHYRALKHMVDDNGDEYEGGGVCHCCFVVREIVHLAFDRICDRSECNGARLSRLQINGRRSTL